MEHSCEAPGFPSVRPTLAKAVTRFAIVIICSEVYLLISVRVNSFCDLDRVVVSGTVATRESGVLLYRPR